MKTSAKHFLDSLISWWVTPKLPKEHIFIPPDKKPGGFLEVASVYLRKWLIHPIKRRFAKCYLTFLKRFGQLQVVAITGSAGKTSTKDMLYSILGRVAPTVASVANIDPVYNIPTTILKCSPKTRYLILEMGVEYPGEMDFYLWLAKPDIGVITNIYPTHTLFFKDVAGVGREKGKLVKSLPSEKTAVLNSDNPTLKKMVSKIDAKTVWFGKDRSVSADKFGVTWDLKSEFVLKIGESKVKVTLPILGKQFVQNSLAAAAAAEALGIKIADIKKGLEDFTPQEHRMQTKKLKSGTILIDDSYNSNPQALSEALLTLKDVSEGKTTVAVLGDMLELGEKEEDFHRAVAEEILDLKIDYFIGVGPLMKIAALEAEKKMGDKAIWVGSPDGVLGKLKAIINSKTVLLIKGSRSVGLDKIVPVLY